MVDSALLWLGFLAVIGVAATLVATFRDTDGEHPQYALGVSAVAFAGVFELAGANGYLNDATSQPLAGAFLLLAVVVVTVELRTRWRAWST